MIQLGYLVFMALAVSGAAGAPQPDEPGAPVRLLPGAPEGPKLLKRRAPGLVFLDCIIGEDGRMEDVAPLAGPPELEAVAAKAVREWVYEAPTQNGRPMRLATVVSVSFVIDPGVLRELLRRSLLHPNPLVRAAAARMEVAQGKAGVGPLISVLGDEDPRVRTAAVLGLQEIGRAARKAIPSLKVAALESDEAVRAAATRALVALEPR